MSRFFNEEIKIEKPKKFMIVDKEGKPKKIKQPKRKPFYPHESTGELKKMAKGGRADVMPKRNKKNFRPTEKGAGMTRAGVAAYRRANPGSKLKRQGLLRGGVARGCGRILPDRKKVTKVF